MRRRTNVIIFGTVSLGVGIYIGRYIDLTLPSLIAGVLFLTIFKDYLLRYWLGIGLCCLAVGNYRGVEQNSGFEILRSNFGQSTIIEVKSIDDAEYDDRGQLTFNATDIIMSDGQRVPGQVTISGFEEFNVQRGDIVEATGKMFAARGSSQARMSFASLDLITKDSSWYNSLRRQMVKKLRDNLPEPLSSFAAGLLIGQRSTIPDKVIEDLRISGLAHIIAVSGYNLTILVRGTMKILKRFSRYQKLMLSLSLVGVFLLITGFSASIVRASIVCGLSLIAWYYGRNFRPAVLLTIVAAMTAYIKPEYIWGDVGWYLSFLAFSGILIVSPILKNRFFGPKRIKFLSQTTIDTLAVLIMIIPYSLFIFGNLSLVALPANILVAALVPIAMITSAMVIFIPNSLVVLARPAIVILDSIIEISKFLASLPFASLEIRINIIEMFSVYLLIFVTVYLVWAKTKKRIENSILLQ